MSPPIANPPLLLPTMTRKRHVSFSLQRSRLRLIRTRKGPYGWDGYRHPAFAIQRLRKSLWDLYVSQVLAGEVSPPAGAAGQRFPYF